MIHLVAKNKIPQKGMLITSLDHTKQSVLMENGEICVLDGAIPEITPTRIPHRMPTFLYVNDTFYNCGGVTQTTSLLYISMLF